MRLIDADALKKILLDAYEEYDGYDPCDLGKFAARVDEEIDNAPTVEERPKGEWIEVDDGLVSGQCSLCGWEAVIMETDVCCMPFCPNCGADMRGKKKGKWISVNDRLPEKIGTYLVTLEYKEHGTGVTTLWYHGEVIGWDLRVADVVIAWMPLPEPYKRGDT